MRAIDAAPMHMPHRLVFFYDPPIGGGKMIFYVTAESFNRKTGVKSSEPRTERIDTGRNRLFDHCRNADEVKRMFEEFWNEVNPDSVDVVKVLEVSETRPLDSKCYCCKRERKPDDKSWGWVRLETNLVDLSAPDKVACSQECLEKWAAKRRGGEF